MNIYAYATQYTRQQLEGRRNPQINLTNAKPFRTKHQKQEARRDARKCEDGAIRSPAPVSYHRPFRASAE